MVPGAGPEKQVTGPQPTTAQNLISIRSGEQAERAETRDRGRHLLFNTDIYKCIMSLDLNVQSFWGIFKVKNRLNFYFLNFYLAFRKL